MEDDKKYMLDVIRTCSSSGFYLTKSTDVISMIEEYTEEQIKIVKDGGVNAIGGH